MKRRVLVILFLIACLAANAQNVGKTISVDNLTVNVAGGMLDIGFTVTASGLHIKSDDRLSLEFAVENDGVRMVLPQVVYSGKQRYRYDRREAEYTDASVVKPYRVYKGVKKNEVYTLDYRVSVPYSA